MLFRTILQTRRLADLTGNVVRSILLSAVLLTIAGGAFAQGIDDYAYVHKTLVNLESPPWRCVCYSVSRSSLIDTHIADNQVWVVSRHNSWANAVAQRDMLAIGSNICSFCPASAGRSSNPVQFYVFENCNSGRCTIGVADSNYAVPGWARISQPFANDREAWRYACQLHASQRSFSPDIHERKVNCAALDGGRSASGLAGYRKIPGAFINGKGIGIAERGHTAESCAARCDAQSRCQSFEITGDWCSINVVSSRPDPSILTRSQKYTLYERN